RDWSSDVCSSDLLRAAERTIDLLEVAVDHRVARDVCHLRHGGQALVSGSSIRGADIDVLAPEFVPQLVQVEHDGKPRTVAHKQPAFPVVEVAAGARHNDPDLALNLLLLARDVAAEELLVRQTTREHQ